jgi:hypothetical protein
MAYLDGDVGLNDPTIEHWVLHSMDEMQAAFYHSVKCVVCVDRTSDWPDCTNSNTRYYEISAGYRTLLVDCGELNMGSPATLSDFIIWAKTNNPAATNYALVLTDHGGGWRGTCIDNVDASGAGDWMTMADLTTALSVAKSGTGVTFSMLGFDSCLMADTEVAYQVKNYANVMVASEQTERVFDTGTELPPYDPGSGGWPWTAIITDLSNQITADGAGLATIVCNDFKIFYEGNPFENVHWTISAVKLQTTSFTTLVTAVNSLGYELNKRLAKYRADIKVCANGAQAFPPGPTYRFVDLYDFVDQVDACNMGETRALIHAMGTIRTQIDNMKVAEYHSELLDSRAHGLSVFLPWGVSDYYPLNPTDPTYDALAFTTAAPNWNVFLKAYLQVP